MKITKRDVISFIVGAALTLILIAVFHPESDQKKAERAINDAKKDIENIFK